VERGHRTHHAPPVPTYGHVNPSDDAQTTHKVSFASCAPASVAAILRVNRGWTRRCGDAGAATPYACPRASLPTHNRRRPTRADRRAAPRGGRGAHGPPRPSAKTPPAGPAHPVSPSSIPPPHERPVTTCAWPPRRRRPVLSPRAGAFRVARCKIAPILRPFSHLPCYPPRADCSRFPSTGPRHTRSGPCRACV